MARVVERVTAHGLTDRLVVATDSPMVARVAERTGVDAILTSDRHATGTERVAEVAAQAEFRDFDVIANLQGDEPFLSRDALAGAIARVRDGDDIGTAAAPMEAADVQDPARVKVVTDLGGRALYFSRAVIPHCREAGEDAAGLYWQHIGLYVCRREALERWVALAPTRLETVERLEQLRALEHGMSIGVARLAEPALPGIDTPDDLRRAEAHWYDGS